MKLVLIALACMLAINLVGETLGQLVEEDSLRQNATKPLTLTRTRTRSRRVKRTIFYEDQDALVILMIVFSFKFPLWDRFIATKQNLGLAAALAEFPKPLSARRLRRCVHFDEQISTWIVEVICAYKVPIIPNIIYKKDTEIGVRWKRDAGNLTDHHCNEDDEFCDRNEVKEDDNKMHLHAPYLMNWQPTNRVGRPSRKQEIVVRDHLLSQDKVVHIGNKHMLQLTPGTFAVNAVCYLFDLVFYEDLEDKMSGDEDHEWSQAVLDWTKPLFKWSLRRLCSPFKKTPVNASAQPYLPPAVNDMPTMMSSFCYCLRRRHHLDR